MNDSTEDADYLIGVDFDNTIVTYDDLLLRLALERGLINDRTRRGKKGIRDHIRTLPGGEIEWQRLQGIIYGARMDEARLIDGVRSFFQTCRLHHRRVCIISHKTEYAAYDDSRTNLRSAALAWMTRQGFFEPTGLGLRVDHVYFEDTRAAKIGRIRSLRCAHFVDDLEETFLEPSFPRNVQPILFSAHGDVNRVAGVRAFGTWAEIREYFFP